MPFTKIAPNKYRGPSGKVFNYNQVRLYYTHGGSFPGQEGVANPIREPKKKIYK